MALEEDWDGEGAPAYQEQTVETVADFLYELVERSEVPEATQVRILPASRAHSSVRGDEPKVRIALSRIAQWMAGFGPESIGLQPEV